MKNIGTFASLIILLLVCTTSFAQEQISPPPNGTYWQFRGSQENWMVSDSSDPVGDYEVVYQNSQLKVFELHGDQRIEVNNEGANELKRMVAVGQDDRKYVQLPLFEGKTWSATYYRLAIGPYRGSPTIRISANYTVRGMKKISISAGTFTTLEVEGGYQRNSPDGPTKHTYSYFYNVDCQCVVKFEWNIIIGAASPAIRKIQLIGFGRRVDVLERVQ